MEEIRSASGDVNEMWHWWKTFFLDILNKHAAVAKIKVKGNHIPCVTSELKYKSKYNWVESSQTSL